MGAQVDRSLLAALAQLPLEQREALVMCVLQDVSYDTAAHILDVPVGTVRSRINRARARLRTLLEERCGYTVEELTCENG